MQESIRWKVRISLCSSFLGVCLHHAVRRYNFSTQMLLASYNSAIHSCHVTSLFRPRPSLAIVSAQQTGFLLGEVKSQRIEETHTSANPKNAKRAQFPTRLG